MPMTIQICPVKRLYQSLAEGEMGKCGAIISSASEINAEKLHSISYVFRQYEDLDYACTGRSFSLHDAAAFADFVKGTDGLDVLYCCCDAGESRSPAVAAAVMRYFGLDDMQIWENPHYHPNMLVFEMLAAALAVAVSDEEKDFRLYINQKAFRDAVSHQSERRNHD